MELQRTVHYIEPTDVLIKIMDVQTGKDSLIQIKTEVLEEIYRTLKKYHYETGGIIGVDKQGVISAFVFDEIQHPSLYEYAPNVKFLQNIINGHWRKNDISFVGFVHSHLHNSEISMQDYEYARQLLDANVLLNYVLIGIVDLSVEKDQLKWNFVTKDV